MTTAVYIGRFRPLHTPHKDTIATALKENDQVVVLVGSCGKPRNIKNPFTFPEIEIMIRSCFSSEDNERIFVSPLMDHSYDDSKWLAQVQKAVAQHSDSDEHVRLYGNEKDHSSYYLKLFPQWGFRDIENTTDIHATSIRDKMFSDENVNGNKMLIKAKVPPSTFDFLMAFMETPEFRLLKEEHDFIVDYKKSWEKAPYAPTFVTVDAVVECCGHVLLIQRKFSPGKGLWALPGGFIGANERIEDAVLRELKEETKIRLSTNFLKGSIKGKEVFDSPYRSLRGRTITHAFHFAVAQGELPEVKGSDDAAVARWFPISVVAEMESLIFEDHLDIISHFCGFTKEFKL